MRRETHVTSGYHRDRSSGFMEEKGVCLRRVASEGGKENGGYKTETPKMKLSARSVFFSSPWISGIFFSTLHRHFYSLHGEPGVSLL